MTPELFENICMSSLGHRTSQEQTYDIARLVLERSIPGDFVECGVYAGGQAALMAHALVDYEREAPLGPTTGMIHRRVHLFDSFAGIPAPGPHDVELAGNRGGESACSLEDVAANMERWGVPKELLVYHAGPFDFTIPRLYDGTPGDSFHAARPTSIAMLRLDADLYNSTIVCMEWLYPLVSPGGYVIVDDFNLSGCRKAVLDYFKHAGPAPIAFRKPNRTVTN